MHILSWPGRERWWQQCRESLDGQPINTHIIYCDTEHQGQNRIAGYSQGNAPYVAVLDDDDYLLPGGLTSLLDVLERHPEAVGAYGDEKMIDEAGAFISWGISRGRSWHPITQLCTFAAPHHPWLMRRAVVDRYLPELERWPSLVDYVLHALVTQDGSWLHVDQQDLPEGAGYAWRRHSRGLSKTTGPAIRKRAVQFCTPLLHPSA